MTSRTCPALAALLLVAAAALAQPADPAVVRAEFVFDTTPTPQCHASTIAETKDGLVAAWFAGLRERDPTVGIWLARRGPDGWSKPVEVFNGVQPDGVRQPCWNPVLFQQPDEPLHLFFKVGPSPGAWWGMHATSPDGGRTWSPAQRLPGKILGPIKNKPVLLPDGVLLCGSSTEEPGVGWRVLMERTRDFGRTWEQVGPLNERELEAIQPTIFRWGPGRLQILCRTRQRGVIAECWSADEGRTWGAMTLTALPHPGSGIDGLVLRDGRGLLVYNHTARSRSPLNVAVSADGKAWQAALVLEDAPGKEFSYPAAIQSADGLVHVTYTHGRERIKHVVLDPAKLAPKPIVDGKWPG
jgi:predicted neuraminidase